MGNYGPQDSSTYKLPSPQDSIAKGKGYCKLQSKYIYKSCWITSKVYGAQYSVSSSRQPDVPLREIFPCLSSTSVIRNKVFEYADLSLALAAANSH